MIEHIETNQIVLYMPGVECQVSHVTCHESCVMCNVSFVMCYVSYVTYISFTQSGWVGWLRLCYQQGPPKRFDTYLGL